MHTNGRRSNQVTIGLWLTWCELINFAIHMCEHFIEKFLMNKIMILLYILKLNFKRSYLYQINNPTKLYNIY